ncbi:MAG: phosphoglycerate dehydrogenase, partial [Candidatus Schekmanbacteria bacterium RIFCSPHIGHO2_02_FULL_38_11]
MKILISDKLSKEAVDILSSTPGLEVDIKTDLKPEELKNIIGGYDALVVRSSTKATKEIINAGKNLKIIGRAGIGVDNVDVESASVRGIIVMNTPGGNVITTAEHAISMLMSMTRKIPQACSSMKEGKWEKSRFVGNELYNKTLGIIGMGRIGSLVAQRAKGIEMKVIAFDPFLSKESAQKLNIPLVTLEELLKISDFITIHATATEQTKHLINEKAFSQMKKGVKIVNCSRGSIIDEKALLKALQDGKISGAALDVFEEEPTKNLDLVKHESVICTPHLGASTVEAQANVAIDIAEQLKDYFLNGVIKNAVNLPSVDQTLLPELRKYMDLGEKLGSFVTQLSEGSLEEVSIEYRGEVVELGTSSL